MKILIGNAWPYANGSLHIGHIASLLPGDVLARYHRAKGDEVFFVSGSDCHGTPVAIRARQENKTPQEVSDRYHEEFCACFEKLGFSYDCYDKTSSGYHKAFVTEFHRTLYDGGCVYEKTAPQAYCVTCGKTLTDRFVVGICPDCGEKARGDQCDACGSVPEPENLLEPVCSACGNTPVFKETKHLYIAITKLEQQLKDYISSHPEWRKNALAFSNRYIAEGLRDRAITRELDWGIDVPKAGYEDKKIYIWAENVLGYLSASKQAAEKRGTDFDGLWGENARHYYVHGKDNIPFHTLILPSLLLGHGGGWHLPDVIVSSEHLTLDGRKISTSQNHAVWVKDIINTVHPDSLRYFLIANGPEKRDSDFTWSEYVRCHNGELLGAYGNLVNRTLAFIARYRGGGVPAGVLNAGTEEKIWSLFADAGAKIERTDFRDALDLIFDLVRYGNKYYDNERPWETRHTNSASCDHTLYNCVQIIANLAVLLSPFLPFSSGKVRGWLGLRETWQPQLVQSGYPIPSPELLFTRFELIGKVSP